MLYIFQYHKPSPHYVAAVIPRCKNKEFNDNPNVVLTIGGGQGVFKEETDLPKFVTLLHELRGPILPALRHTDIGQRNWLKLSNVNRYKASLPDTWKCREITPISFESFSGPDPSFSEAKRNDSVLLWLNGGRVRSPILKIEHLPVSIQNSPGYINYYMYVYSLFINHSNNYQSLIREEDVKSFLDLKSGVKDFYFLNIARRLVDDLEFLRPDQQLCWYKKLGS